MKLLFISRFRSEEVKKISRNVIALSRQRNKQRIVHNRGVGVAGFFVNQLELNLSKVKEKKKHFKDFFNS